MKTSIIPSNLFLQKKRKKSWISYIVRKAVIKQLKNVQYGHITLHENNRHWELGDASKKDELAVNVYIHDVRFYRHVAFGGSVGGGEAYILGYWSCDDLTKLIRLMALNRETVLEIESGLAILSRPLFRILHFLNNNSHSGSKKNIKAHYDIGNDLFQLFLDRSMMYSSAVYPTAETPLEEASEYKLDLICRKLQLNAKDHLLEIGTGWGSLAVHAAKHYGCRVTSTTISDEQYSAARKRVKNEGLEHKVSIIKQDYRQLTGQFDKLVSVEMLEAVGHKYFDTFFKKCNSLLKADGLMLLQTITIADQNYESARNSVDFIQRYVFPGGCLPSVSVLSDCVSRVTDFRILHLADYAEHYAKTLSEWRNRFFLNIEQVRKLGYSENFIRLWEYYLCYCEGGFLERVIGVSQLTLAKPLNRDNSLVVEH